MKLSTFKKPILLALASLAITACTHDIYRQNYGYQWRRYQRPAAPTDAAGSPTSLTPTPGTGGAPSTAQPPLPSNAAAH